MAERKDYEDNCRRVVSPPFLPATTSGTIIGYLIYARNWPKREDHRCPKGPSGVLRSIVARCLVERPRHRVPPCRIQYSRDDLPAFIRLIHRGEAEREYWENFFRLETKIDRMNRKSEGEEKRGEVRGDHRRKRRKEEKGGPQVSVTSC